MLNTVTANDEQFKHLTKDLLIVFSDGTYTAYQNLVRGFVLHDGEELEDAVLKAAQQVCGNDVTIGYFHHSPMNTLTDLQKRCHDASYAAGWWHHPESGLPYIPGDSAIGDNPLSWADIGDATRRMITHYWPFVVATKIGLVHSEVSEGMEAYRRGAMDDKLAHRLGLETELADSLIRQFDIAGVMRRAQRLGVVEQNSFFDLNGAVTEKMAFNVVREDHKVDVRRAAGGKVF